MIFFKFSFFSDLPIKLLDIFFTFFHSLLIVFNVSGWAIKPLRRLNLITLGITGFSWFVVGIFYGIGYCPLTEWHFNILEKLGHRGLPDSYIVFLIQRLTSLKINQELANPLIIVIFFMALFTSITLNYLGLRSK